MFSFVFSYPNHFSFGVWVTPEIMRSWKNKIKHFWSWLCPESFHGWVFSLWKQSKIPSFISTLKSNDKFYSFLGHFTTSYQNTCFWTSYFLLNCVGHEVKQSKNCSGCCLLQVRHTVVYGVFTRFLWQCCLQKCPSDLLVHGYSVFVESSASSLALFLILFTRFSIISGDTVFKSYAHPIHAKKSMIIADKFSRHPNSLTR